MKHPPTDEQEAVELERQNAQPWQVDLLALNPAATLWGPEEPMNDPAWDPSGSYGCWADFRQVHDTLDDRNELVHFYFEIGRPSRECSTCIGSGLSPAARQIESTLFDRSVRLTIDECQALVDEGRLWPITPVGVEPTKPIVDHVFLQRVNAANGPQHMRPWFVQLDPVERLAMEHDWLNRRVLIDYRCKKNGIEANCRACSGNGTLYTADAAIATLYLWLILPAKERSCFVTVAPIEQSDLSDVLQFLAMAADRNAQRFAKIVAAATR